MKRSTIILLTAINFGTCFSACNSSHDAAPSCSSGIDKISLTDKNIRDIALLCRIWGMMKYFHPEVTSGAYNWDKELFIVLPNILKANTAQVRDSILLEWISQHGSIDLDSNSFDCANASQPTFSWMDTISSSEKLRDVLKNILYATRPDSSFYVNKTHVGYPEFLNENKYDEHVYPDAGLRLLGLFRLWNAIEYYYPYKSEVAADWNLALIRFIPYFVNAKSAEEYRLATEQLVCLLQDSHAHVFCADSSWQTFKGRRFIPIKLCYIDSSFIVEEIFYQKCLNDTLRKGDKILKIDNISIQSRTQKMWPYAYGSNAITRYRTVGLRLISTNNSQMTLTLLRGSDTVGVCIETVAKREDQSLYDTWELKKPSVRWLGDSVLFLNPGTLTRLELDSLKGIITKARGAIIDFRSYPKDNIAYQLAGIFLRQRENFAIPLTFDLNCPGLFHAYDTLRVGRKNPLSYSRPVIVLVNEWTQSSGEFHVMALQACPSVTVIGSTTAGADGNVSEIMLPGGVTVYFTGIGILYPDGSATQRCGLRVDLIVRPERDALCNNRDLLLEKAMTLVHTPN